MDIIQLLPLNETYYSNFSPYNSISSCALDPIYLGLRYLPYIKENKTFKANIEILQKYNSTDRVHFDKVRKLKFDWLQKYYRQYFSHFKKRKSYQQFISQNPWIKSYSVFRYLKEKFEKKKWESWPKAFQNPTEEWVNSYYKNHLAEIEFYTFLQYLCFSQLCEIKKTASQKKIFLCGDIPMFACKDSADVWFYRKVFDIKKQAGSPPDKFSSQGQAWSLPLLDWDYLKKTDFFWWKQRTAVLSNFFHLYRIDHVVGFFRTWSLNFNDHASSGKFIPDNRKLWKDRGELILKMIVNSSPILPIAEDLGIIPETIYGILKKLGICGLWIIRWHKSTPLCDYEPLSLTSLSTHDTQTFEQWWNENKREAQSLCFTNKWNYNPKLTSSLRLKILKSIHNSSSIFHVNLLQEYLALDKHLVKKQERINVPGKVNKINWTYKYKPSIEELTSNKKLSKIIRLITTTPKN